MYHVLDDEETKWIKKKKRILTNFSFLQESPRGNLVMGVVEFKTGKLIFLRIRTRSRFS